ncbi:MAG: multiple sugar transport system substrate-binding protein [Thermomicrobiales bacterium]|nr:multiple sugar transport system substrate-binding protein [Thermomicrobiales bacterium]
MDRVPLRTAESGGLDRPHECDPASLLEDPRIFEINPVLKRFAEQMACGATNASPNLKWDSDETALNDAFGRAIYGEVSASDALDEAAEEAQVELKG